MCVCVCLFLLIYLFLFSTKEAVQKLNNNKRKASERRTVQNASTQFDKRNVLIQLKELQVIERRKCTAVAELSSKRREGTETLANFFHKEFG